MGLNIEEKHTLLSNSVSEIMSLAFSITVHVQVFEFNRVAGVFLMW